MPSQLTTLCQEARLYLAWNTVKAKGAGGGIDGVSVLEFEKEKRKQIPKLAEELRNGTWKPQPYLEIEVVKNKTPDEIRKLGMTSIRDKIVQHAIKSVIEPRFEKLFLGNSYGYRPGKGATKAIRRVLAECKAPYNYVLRLDIDNFFDTIDHQILQKRLVAVGLDNEIVRLVMLFFRSQVVDRVAIRLIQKGHNLGMHKGLLTDQTRQLLVKSVMDRLARYEKYQGEEMKMEQIILRQAKLLAKAYEGTEKFKPYVAKW